MPSDSSGCSRSRPSTVWAKPPSEREKAAEAEAAEAEAANGDAEESEEAEEEEEEEEEEGEEEEVMVGGVPKPFSHVTQDDIDHHMSEAEYQRYFELSRAE